MENFELKGEKVRGQAKAKTKTGKKGIEEKELPLDKEAQ